MFGSASVSASARRFASSSRNFMPSCSGNPSLAASNPGLQTSARFSSLSRTSNTQNGFTEVHRKVIMSTGITPQACSSPAKLNARFRNLPMQSFNKNPLETEHRTSEGNANTDNLRDDGWRVSYFQLFVIRKPAFPLGTIHVKLLYRSANCHATSQRLKFTTTRTLSV